MVNADTFWSKWNLKILQQGGHLSSLVGQLLDIYLAGARQKRAEPSRVLLRPGRRFRMTRLLDIVSDQQIPPCYATWSSATSPNHTQSWTYPWAAPRGDQPFSVGSAFDLRGVCEWSIKKKASTSSQIYCTWWQSATTDVVNSISFFALLTLLAMVDNGGLQYLVYRNL